MVSVILDNGAEVFILAEIFEEYPPLTLENVRSASAYAEALAREEKMPSTRS